MVSLKLIYYEHFNFFFECTQIVIVSKDKYYEAMSSLQGDFYQCKLAEYKLSMAS